MPDILWTGYRNHPCAGDAGFVCPFCFLWWEYAFIVTVFIDFPSVRRAEDHESDNSSSFSRSYCAKPFNIRNHLAFTMTPFYRYTWSPHVTKQTSLMSKVWGFSAGLESSKAGSRILDVNRWPEETEQL